MRKFPPVLILAGGLGTRISSICPDLPKSLVPVNGRPFVEVQLRLLARQGVDEVVMCVAHLMQPLVDFVADGARFGLKVQYSSDGDQLLGTGGAVRKAARIVSSPFAVLYGDSYLDVPFMPMYEAFVQSKKEALISVYRNNNNLIPSNLLVEKGVVLKYDKKNPTPDMVHIDFGLSIFQASTFDEFANAPFDLSDAIQDLIQRGQLAAFESEKRFFEVGTPEGVKDLERYLDQTELSGQT